jgi:hypothetical protein
MVPLVPQAKPNKAMPPIIKQAKIVFDGRSYWIIWNWQLLPSATSPVDALWHYAGGPFISPEEAEEAIPPDWAILPFER